MSKTYGSTAVRWETVCGSTPASLVQLGADAVAISHDGVLFIARRR